MFDLRSLNEFAVSNYLCVSLISCFSRSKLLLVLIKISASVEDGFVYLTAKNACYSTWSPCGTDNEKKICVN